MKKLKPIKTFIINLEKRTDRLIHIKSQFENYTLFDVNIVKAKEMERGALGLWLTVKSIVSEAHTKGYPYILIVEDDHVFTTNFNEEQFFDAIEFAIKNNAEILLGGVSWFDFTVKISNNLNWVNQFTGFQFTLLFENIYSKILDCELSSEEVTDKKISSLSGKKYCLFPFVSNQAEFGYSDVTIANSDFGVVDAYFKSSSRRFQLINKIYDYYR